MQCTTTTNIDNTAVNSFNTFSTSCIGCFTIKINCAFSCCPNSLNGVNVGVFDGYLCTISCKRCRFYIYAICFNAGIFTNRAKLSITILFAIFIVITCSYTAALQDNLRAAFCFKIACEINVSRCQSRVACYCCSYFSSTR